MALRPTPTSRAHPSSSLAKASLLASLLLLSGIPGSPAAARDLAVDDLLAMEGIGAVTFSPDGRLFIERHRPYHTVGQEVRPFLDDRDRAELLVVEGEALPRPAFAQSADEPAWLASLSPSGRKLAVMWFEGPRLRLGVLDQDAARPVPLDVTPQLLPFIMEPLWLSEDELLIVETAPGEAPLSALDEAGYLRNHPILASGKDAGPVAPVTVLHGGRMGVNQPPPGGALVAVRADGTARQVIAEGRFIQVSRSPDGRHAAALREASYLQPDPARPLAHAVPRQRDLVLIDLERRNIRTLCKGCDSGQLVPDWSPDGQRLLLFDYGRTGDRPEGLYEVTLDGRMAPVAPSLRIDGEWGPKFMKAAAAQYAAGGLFLIGRPRDAAGERDDWYWVAPGDEPVKLTGSLAAPGRRLVATLEDGAALLIADACLWRIAAGTAPQCLFEADGVLDAVGEEDGFGGPITPHAPAVVTLRETAPDGSRRLHFIDIASVASTTSELPDDAEVLSASSMAAGAAVLSRDGKLSLVRGGGAARPLLQVNRHLADVTRPEIHKLVRKDRTGTDVVDWLILPTRRGVGPMPLVVDLYPGRVQSAAQSGYERPRVSNSFGPHLLLGHGYGVLRVSVPLEQGVAGEPLADTGREVGLALDRVLATGLVDPARLVLYGHSFGGYGTAAALASEKRFAAAVAMAGPMNLASHYGEFDVRRSRDVDSSLTLFGASLSEGGQAAMGGPPWRDPERYVRNSPLFQAHRIETPLLLIHGDADYISIRQAEEMFTALYRQAKDVTLLRYWGEGHYFSRPRTMIDLDMRVPAWLNARLSEAQERRTSGPVRPSWRQ